MRDTFEQYGSAWFAPCQELHSGATFQAASPPWPRAQQQGQQAQQAQQQAAAADAAAEQGGEGQQGQGEEQQDEQEQWQSQWAAAGWLQDNPLVRPQLFAKQRSC